MNEHLTRRESAMMPVAAAVIADARGRVLLAERPAGKPYAGFWEFPGGKMEVGESDVAALARELAEELGIRVTRTAPWLTTEYAYPKRTVRLHFHRVLAWDGALHGREGQRLAWVEPSAPAVAPLLDANAPILRALTLPPIYAITPDVEDFSAFAPRLEAALARGVRLIQVRHKGDASARARLAASVLAAARPAGARVLINGDVALAERLGADGVHLTARQLRDLDARPALPWCAASCHGQEELARAAALKLDFAVLSPVQTTASHPGAQPLGWSRLRALVAGCPLPVYALGGMTPDDLARAQAQGAHGVALLSGAWPASAEDIPESE